MELSLGSRPWGDGRVTGTGGEIDLATAPRIRELLPIASARHGRVVLDRVTSADPAGVSVLVATVRRTRLRASASLLAAPPPLAVRVPRLTGLDPGSTAVPCPATRPGMPTAGGGA